MPGPNTTSRHPKRPPDGVPRIVSPMATGNGAYVVHTWLQKHIPGYRVVPYNPYWTVLPFLLPLFRDTRADLVHTTPDYAAFFRVHGKPLILSFQNYVLDPFMRAYSSPAQRLHYRTGLRWLTRRAVSQADAITAVSKFTAEKATADLGIAQKIRIIYNGVDESVFTPPADQHTPRRPLTVLFSGNLTRRKGAHLLPEIARHLDPCVRIVYTTGLRATARLAAIPQIESLGAVPYPQMPALYQRVDLLLMPTAREGLSLAVLEAMACGLPVVGSDASSMSELIIHGKGGYLCPLDAAGGFADAINRLAADSKTRREMGQYNRARIESQFTLAQMVSEYRELFESVLVRR